MSNVSVKLICIDDTYLLDLYHHKTKFIMFRYTMNYFFKKKKK